MVSKERKISMTFSMNKNELDLIEILGKGKTTSAKLSWILNDCLSKKDLLVAYMTNEEWENGTPKIIGNDPTRLYSYSHYAEGIDDPEELVGHDFDRAFEIAKEVLGKNKRMPTEKLIPLLVEAGYIVQFIENSDFGVFEVWIDLKQTGNAGCKECPKIDRIILDVERVLNKAKGAYNEA